MAVVFALLLAVTGLTTKTMLDANKQFSADGYVLVPSRDTEVTTNVNEQYYFSAGTNYRKKYGQTIQFKDTSNKEVSMGTEEFVHYNDGSLGAFTKGVVMDLAEISDNQVTYYGVSDKTTILKQGQDYSMSYLGNSLTLKEFIWKIADDTFMLVSPEIKIHLAEGIEVVLEDYVQVQYVAGGIARLVHQRGTYQTVSDDAFIQSDSGFELKLTERAFYNGLEKAVSLDEMVIDSSTNLMVDENEESLKIPTFRVVNGKDGADGADGFTGEDGVSGEDGSSGDNGEKGQNGYDGMEGDSGEWGYDGQVGESGKDAQHAESGDGIVGIVQESAPTVGIDPESYKVGTNSVEMMLKINDPNSMLTGDDLVCSIFRSDDLSTVVYQTTISTGMTGGTISTNNLQPGVDYVFIVEGSYESKANGAFSNVSFMTKLFRTDDLGLSIEKVQVTEDTITVKTVKTEDSLVANYGVGLYLGDDTTNLTSLGTNSYSDSMEFVFKTDNMISGAQLTPNTKYKIQLTNISAYTDETKSSFSNVGADVSKEVTTLKVKPYYKVTDKEGNVTKEQVSNKVTKILTSSRYQTAAVSLDTSIVDEHNGIKGYRYELYETLTDASNLTTPIQTKEVQVMETVTFNIEPQTNYFARVVVLFDDNEKLVELISNPSNVVSLEHTNYPTVQFINLTHTYDSVSGYVMVEDKSTDQDMLLAHSRAVNDQAPDYPLRLSVTAQTGKVQTIDLISGATPPGGNADTLDYVEYFYFKVDGLARDTTHTVSVTGYINDMNMAWDSIDDSIKAQKSQYLSGYNINVGSPSPILLSMRAVPNVDDNLFTIAVAFTDADANDDASYEVSNMEKITFKLVNAATGATIGTTANMMDDVTERHASDYRQYYASKTAVPDAANLPYSAVENQPYSKYVLTDESFGAKGDSRISNGGDFKIIVEKAYDYTHSDEFPFTNELKISGQVEFKVEESHTRVTDPNAAVSVSPIKNGNLETPISTLEDDTIVGLNVDTGYTLSDVHQIVYYIYELTSDSQEPIVSDDDPTDTLNNTESNGYWANPDKFKIKTVKITDAPEASGSARPWTVYFNDMDTQSATRNLDDAGRKIFERGKVYFIRYEIVTNGSLKDTKVEKRYPHCSYTGLSDDEMPFYRSNVFGIERQIPTLQRYLWDTVNVTDGINTTVTQQWKYKLNDPDNAILAFAEFNKATVEGQLTEYASFDDAFGKNNGTLVAKSSLTALYDDSTPVQPKATYELVEMTGLKNNMWYTLDIPYCIFEKNTRTQYETENIGSILSAPGEVKEVSHISTNIQSVHNNAQDYVVDGVMVKDVAELPGVKDEWGYRIRITLQGSQIERVSALKVTVSGNNGIEDKVVVYDPVPIEIQQDKEGDNFYAYAYLEYLPIVEAGINHKNVTIKVDAYYTTNRAGMNSFTAYAGGTHTNGNTVNDNVFTHGSAWALKGYDYAEINGITSYAYEYQRILSENGILNNCQKFVKDQMNSSLETNTLAGSVFIPKIVDGVNQGFADERTLALKYAVTPLVYTEQTDNSFSDVMYLKELSIEPDEVGAYSPEGTSEERHYYVLEELGVQSLKIDFSDGSEDYKVATFTTGDGMPGIAENEAGKSSGMSSATLQFDIKGALPGDDKGYYIYLYDATTYQEIALKKMQEAGDGTIYYLTETGNQTTVNDTTIAASSSANNYGMLASDDGKKVTFAIRGLDKNHQYFVKIRAKDTQGNLQDLFDYSLLSGGQPYYFKTQKEITIVSGEPTFIYNEYMDKRVSFPYAVEGSEGTGMRIFYRVYDKQTGLEVECGRQTKTTHGYMLEPKGNQVKFYHSDMTQCNPGELNFLPGGLLALNTTYVIEYSAYTTTNEGIILDEERIGYTTKEFITPSNLAAPHASVRAVSGSTSVDVTVVMYDNEKTIYDGKFFVKAYDLAGNPIPNASELTIEVNNGSGSTVHTGKIVNLPPNGAYKIEVSAPIDRNNDGQTDDWYKSELAVNTISTASATISTSYDDTGKLILNIRDMVNFDNVDNIKYSIDSGDGTTNFVNGSLTMSQLAGGGNRYQILTDFAPESGEYSYMIHFYNGPSLLGSTKGDFTK